MRTLFLFVVCLLLASCTVKAQNDSIQPNDLLSEITTDDTTTLLPDKFLITQRILWGQRGLMRNLNYFELTPEKRQNELKVRRIMLVSHQVIGLATLGGMVAQGIVGTKLYNFKDVKDVHEMLAVGVNIGYFTTASLSLFAPPKMLNERKGYSSIKLHKALAIIHLTSMIATNILATQLESNYDLRPYHRAAAFTAFGAYAASMIVIKF